MGAKHGTLAERLARMVVQGGPDECWLFTGTSNGKGYGTLWDLRTRGAIYAHRAAWEGAFGPVPAGLCVLHHCDNRRCCNPDHLFLGTIADNNRDMSAKGRNVMQGPDRWRVTMGVRRYAHEHPGMSAGTRNGRARLHEETVPVIRARYAAGGVILAELAEEYGVTIQSIWAAIQRKTWKHVP